MHGDRNAAGDWLTVTSMNPRAARNILSQGRCVTVSVERVCLVGLLACSLLSRIAVSIVRGFRKSD